MKSMRIYMERLNIMGPLKPLIIRYGEINNLPDEEIVQLVLNRDKHVYKIIINRYSQQLYRVIYAILHDADSTRETLQISFVKAYEKLSQFKGQSKYSTWLTRIAINEALMKQRKEKKYTVGLESHESRSFYNIHCLFHSGRYNPEMCTIRNEIRHLIENAIASLPEKYRVVFQLREVDGFDVEETSKSLRISPGNVKIRLHRAKKRLRELLRDHNFTDDYHMYNYPEYGRTFSEVVGPFVK